MSDQLWALVWFLVICGLLAVVAFKIRARGKPAVTIRPPGNPIYALEHECWPTQTIEWFGHDDTCATCGARRLGVPNHLDNPLWKQGRLLPHVSPTPAEVDYWLTGLGTWEQIRRAGYEPVPVTELGSAETRYVKGWRIDEWQRGQVEPRVAARPLVIPRADWREPGAPPDWDPANWTLEQGGRPDWLPGDPV
jgi:hypothetical protein